MARFSVAKPLLFIACAVPLALLVWRGVAGDLGANPVETITHETGTWALRLLLVTLAITPLRTLSGWSQPVRLRRMLGLWSFAYALLHFVTWAWLDQGFYVEDMLQDIIKRPYITVGFTALSLMLPLAATSSNGMIKRLGGKRWKQLHKLVYICAITACLHYLWLVKADTLQPMIYLIILLTLFVLRLPAAKKLRIAPANAA